MHLPKCLLLVAACAPRLSQPCPAPGQLLSPAVFHPCHALLALLPAMPCRADPGSIRDHMLSTGYQTAMAAVLGSQFSSKSIAEGKDGVRRLMRQKGMWWRHRRGAWRWMMPAD